MTKKEIFLYYMSICEIPNKKQEIMLEEFDDFSIDNVLVNRKIHEIVSPDEYKRMVDKYDPQSLSSSLDNMRRSGIEILTIFSERYPKSLIDLPDRPLILYAKGDLSLLDQKCLAIVGTRMPSGYGKLITEKFASKLAECGLVIVSGLCYGVDAYAHRGALEVGGKTIAVIASGFNNIYPSSNFNLAQEIAEKGLLLSEYPPSFKPRKYTFPHRNRIVAGLSLGVLITEAGLQSGTNHTKEFALEYGRDVFAVPGNVNSSKSELTNHIIKTAQGECVLSPDDIIEYYGLEKQNKELKALTLSFDERLIMQLLEKESLDFDYLAEKTQIPVNILNSCLTTLEIRGLIRKLPAQMYAAI